MSPRPASLQLPPSPPPGWPGDRSVAWQRLDVPGTEHCQLRRDATGVTLDGALAVLLDGAPTRVTYTVRCTAAWETRRVDVHVVSGLDARDLVLTVDASRRWWRDGHELPTLAGCVDVDLAVTPSTNTLPMRRLDLAVGARAEVTAAWVQFPDLTLERLPQTYARTAVDLYQYESAGGAFTAELSVDDAALVTRYPGLWERLGG